MCLFFRQLYLNTVVNYGRRDQIEEFATPFVDGKKVVSFALSEPGKIEL